jgi:TM2 domain-containing membrane protein YozV
MTQPDPSTPPPLWTSGSPVAEQGHDIESSSEQNPVTTTSPARAAFCRACGQSIDERATICPKCGVPQAAVGNPAGSRSNEAKSAGLAIFLSFIWPGAGHLYAGGENEKGIIFTCISGLCFLISWTIIGLVLTVPVWFGTAIYTMIDSNRLVQARNAHA